MSKGHAKLLALIGSVAVHLFVLGTLTALRFSGDVSQVDSAPIHQASIMQIQRLIQADRLFAKPKTSTFADRQALDRKPAGESKPVLARPKKQNSEKSSVEIEQIISRPAWQPAGIEDDSIEFFGSRTKQRRICYLLDCSGSMTGLFSRVKVELIRSIETLEQDQYFSVVFFSNDKVSALAGDELIRASARAKSSAINYVKSAAPAGKTNAIEGLKKAGRLRDSTGRKAQIIFFLTDGFEIAQPASATLRDVLPAATINTIGFWPSYEDCKLLRDIASGTGGRFTRIGDRDLRKE